MPPVYVNRVFAIAMIVMAILVILPYERFNVSKKGILVIKIIYAVAILSISVWFLLQSF
ncbi:MAG: hypothetical protein JW817_01100 [Clostridiales bacterium]|nr:hypothetical protein [Clostridiales bacterium]